MKPTKRDCHVRWRIAYLPYSRSVLIVVQRDDNQTGLELVHSKEHAMNKTVFTSFAAISILGLASTSIAAGDEKITFESLDKNNDGYVERTDIPADHDLANLFASYDMNQDNRLSAVEFNRYLGQDEAEEAEE